MPRVQMNVTYTREGVKDSYYGLSSGCQASEYIMWKQFASHRRRVTDLLATLLPVNGSLCLLGAGGTNDVSLARLLAFGAEIHLVDVDLAAMQAGVKRQGVANSPAIHLHGPVDVSGIAPMLCDRDASPLGDGAGRLVQSLSNHRCNIAGQPFSVVVSTAMLTQLIQSVVASALGPEEALPVILALRDKHLGDLVQLTAPGGWLLLISDVVSTATAPKLAKIPAAELSAAMAALIAENNFFTGTNPYRLTYLLAQDPRFRDDVTDVRLLAPWLWRVRPRRQHLVYAIAARRTISAAR
jgi:hypothetical protein